jgi:signal peptidase I
MFNLQKDTVRTFIITFIIACCIWVIFGPIQLGGDVSYVIISGNSMEPDFHNGDLVVTRKQPKYGIENRVVYAHPQLGFVFHRIIGLDGENFVLKGDNNYWLDSYQPAQDEILGKYWFFIPSGGTIIRTLRMPLFFSIFVVLILTFGTSLLIFKKDPLTSAEKRSKTMNGKRQSHPAGNSRQELLLLLGILAAIGIVFGAYAFSKPLVKNFSDDIFYSHKSELVYSASDTAGIFDRPGLRTGDPVYPLLNCKVDLDLHYELSGTQMSADDLQSLMGDITLFAVLRDTDGWNRTFQLIPKYEFSGSKVNARTSIDICSYINKISLKESKTGAGIRAYTLSISPEINIIGTYSGIGLNNVFQSEFMFDLSETVLRPTNLDEGFIHTQDEVLSNVKSGNNTLTIISREMDVKTARYISIAIVGLCLLASIYPFWTLYEDWRKSEITKIQIQHHPMLVEIMKWTPIKKGTPVIDVAQFQDIVKIAERIGSVIMHKQEGNDHLYRVQDECIIYQFLVQEPDESLD